MTFRVEDTTTICIDTCFWPPFQQLAFSRFDAAPYVPRDNMPYCFSLSSDSYVLGDANGDGVIDLGDVVYLINYLYRNGPAPDPLWIGDCNCDEITDLGDVVYLINYLYKEGDPPGC